MLIIWIPVSLLVFYLVLRLIYRFLWKKGLSVSLYFEEKKVEEGTCVTLVEKVTNDKGLPLPVVRLAFKLDRSLVIEEDENASVSDRTNVSEYFGLFGHEEVKRRQKVRASKRGVYGIETASLILPDFFTEDIRAAQYPQEGTLMVAPSMLDSAPAADVSRQIVGQVLSRARLYQDIFSFRGIREYVPGDPLSMVNWKASARTGSYMVNMREYTGGIQLRILLDLERPAIRYSPDILEDAIRLAYTLAGDCIRRRIPVSLVSNGRDPATGRETEVPAGSSDQHMGTLGEALARISLDLPADDFSAILRQERENPPPDPAALCLIASAQSDALIREAGALSEACGGLVWICPLDPEIDRKPLPRHITFLPVEL